MGPLVTVHSSNSDSPGISNDPVRWRAARITASSLQVFLEMWKNTPVSQLKGDEFESAKHLVTHIQASAGVFLDAIHTASSIDDLLAINKEFHAMAAAKS